jgi:hypothetical protein
MWFSAHSRKLIQIRKIRTDVKTTFKQGYMLTVHNQKSKHAGPAGSSAIPNVYLDTVKNALTILLNGMANYAP